MRPDMRYPFFETSGKSEAQRAKRYATWRFIHSIVIVNGVAYRI